MDEKNKMDEIWEEKVNKGLDELRQEMEESFEENIVLPEEEKLPSVQKNKNLVTDVKEEVLNDKTERTILESKKIEETPESKKIEENSKKDESEIFKTNIDSPNINEIEEKNNKTNKFLEDLKVDLNNIKMVDASPMSSIKNFEFALNTKSKTQVVANQSNYIAYLEGLNYNDISTITNNNLDDFASQTLLMQTVHSKINTTNIGKLTYDEWINITSYYDLDSFMYGIYLGTFPGDTKFNIKCGHCGETIEAKVNNDTLVSGKNEESYKNLQTILNNKANPRENLKYALTNQKERIMLNDSKIIIDIKLPTIKKQLEIIGSVGKVAKEKIQHILSMMIFLDKVLMLDLEKTMSENEACYYEVNDKNELAKIISNLSFNDAKQIGESITTYIDKYAIEYKVKSFKCPKCQEDIGDIPVDMEELLFHQILQL